MATERCDWCSQPDHIDQQARWVDKHEHYGSPPRTYPCDKPWSAGCQTSHGSLCFIGDYATQQEAVIALDGHLIAGVHLQGCEPDNEPAQGCRTTIGETT